MTTSQAAAEAYRLSGELKDGYATHNFGKKENYTYETYCVIINRVVYSSSVGFDDCFDQIAREVTA